jgi:hypothetical protein
MEAQALDKKRHSLKNRIFEYPIDFLVGTLDLGSLIVDSDRFSVRIARSSCRLISIAQYKVLVYKTVQVPVQ